MPETALAAPSASEAAAEAAVMGGRASSGGMTGKNLESAFGNLEKFAKPPTTEATTIPPHPAQKKEPVKETPAPAKEEPTKDETIEAKDETPAAAAKEEIAKPVETPAKPKKPADFLREELTKTKTERDTLKAEIEKLKSASTAEHPEVKTLTEQVEALRKEKAKLEEEFRYVDYEKSPEYKQKFWQPYESAWNEGREIISQLMVNTDEGETRPGTAQDFDRIMDAALKNPGAAAEMMENMLGASKAATLAPYIKEVRTKGKAALQAVDEFKKTAADREKQWAETSSRVAKEISDHWTAATKPEAIPDQWKPYVLPKGSDKDGNPIDKEGDALLEKGLAEFDRAANENARNPNLTKEQREAILGRAAAIRNKAASFNRLVRDLRAKDAEITALKKELEDFKKSEPGGGDGERDSKPTGAYANTMEGALAGLEKRATPTFH